MIINPLKDIMDKNPQESIVVTKKQFFEYFYKLLNLRGLGLTENEIKVLSTLSANMTLEDTGISKNNLPPVLKKLEEKGLILNKELTEVSKSFATKLVDDVTMIIKFEIENDTGQNN